ncbi:MAG TPA: type IX secretion system membrane protein PorP/SprF [Catalimonadaceae bacterium]|nr:type IX secretion system membrane protein PorP/SprF [Catalimonadaceae bacterium]HPI10455.1 type IX secretion system membrane protein PorP/SprF [Catalimonadaceae bacterium]
MKRQLYAALFFAGSLGISTSYAQQDAHLTQYMFNQLYFNPAAAGVEQGFRGGLLYRNQWTGYKGLNDMGGAPQNILFTGSLPILEANTGIGLVVLNDQIGAQNDLQANLNAAYHFKLGSGKLSAGLRAGIHSRSLSGDKYRVNDPNDPTYQDLKSSSGQIIPDFGFGLYYTSDKFFAGLSSTHLLEPKFDFSGSKEGMSRHFYVMGGYNFDLSPDIVLTPSMNLKYDSKVFQYELSALARFNNQFIGGLAYRQGDALSAIVGLTALQNRLRITYSLDYTVPSTEAKKPTSHEIMASYFIPMTMKGPKPIIRTPRYRK